MHEWKKEQCESKTQTHQDGAEGNSPRRRAFDPINALNKVGRWEFDITLEKPFRAMRTANDGDVDLVA